jgi:hypothetical protein
MTLGGLRAWSLDSSLTLDDLSFLEVDFLPPLAKNKKVSNHFKFMNRLKFDFQILLTLLFAG